MALLQNTKLKFHIFDEKKKKIAKGVLVSKMRNGFVHIWEREQITGF